MDKKIILFELNEVPLRIVDQYCQWFPKSTLARRLPECRQHETYAEDLGHLSPWTTWPSLHRGVADRQHFIANFGQDLREVDREFPPLWRMLADSRIKTGVCGSLHSYPLPESLDSYAFYLPDTFAAGSECFPNELSLFQEFNLRMSRESGGNVSSRIPWKQALDVLRAAPELGLRFRTFVDTGRQLISERMRSWRKVRRRTYQTVLAFDVFMKQLVRTRPDFTTFFTNHVASSMHRYWAASFPGDYDEIAYDSEWMQKFSHEIQFTMNKFDGFLARLLKFVDANPHYNLWIATSMGQAATTAQPVETQLLVTDVQCFMAALGLQPAEWSLRAAMVPQLNLTLHGEQAMAKFRAALADLRINGKTIRYQQADYGFFCLKLGHNNLHLAPTSALLRGQQHNFAELGMSTVEIDDKSACTAYHIPQGTLLIYDPLDRSHKQQRTQISTLDIAPAILANYSITPPGYMRRPPALIGDCVTSIAANNRAA